MRILRIIGSMNPVTGGPCQGIRNSVEALSALGVETEVVCMNAPDEAFLGQDKFPVHALGPGSRWWSRSSRLRPWLRENLNRFDAVILHGLWLYPNFGFWREWLAAGGDSGVPYYVFPHGMLDSYFQHAEGRRIKAWRNQLYWKLIESRVVRSARAVLFTCEEELRLARQPFPCYAPRLALNVGYGVAEPPTFSDSMREAFLRVCPAVAGRRYLLFLSRVHKKKGVDDLIRAYGALASDAAKAGNDVPDLVIAGPVESAYGRQMRVLAAGLTGGPRIHFPGMLVGEAKWGAFNGCEAFVLPSHQENFGIAVVEALACGRPVLISDQVNIWRDIEGAQGGLVEPDTLAGVARLLRRWCSMGEDARASLKPRECFETQFATGRVAARLLDALQSK